MDVLLNNNVLSLLLLMFKLCLSSGLLQYSRSNNNKPGARLGRSQLTQPYRVTISLIDYIPTLKGIETIVFHIMREFFEILFLVLFLNSKWSKNKSSMQFHIITTFLYFGYIFVIIYVFYLCIRLRVEPCR